MATTMPMPPERRQGLDLRADRTIPHGVRQDRTPDDSFPQAPWVVPRAGNDDYGEGEWWEDGDDGPLPATEAEELKDDDPFSNETFDAVEEDEVEVEVEAIAPAGAADFAFSRDGDADGSARRKRALAIGCSVALAASLAAWWWMRRRGG